MVTTVDDLAAFVNAVCERMIPPTDVWPSATEIGVGEAVVAYLRDREWTGLVAALEKLGGREHFMEKSGEEQDQELAALESSAPELFASLRQVIYLGYYAQPRVVETLRTLGYDVNVTPQPDGYEMKPFDSSRVPTGGRGVWIPTEAVGRAKRSGA